MKFKKKRRVKQKTRRVNWFVKTSLWGPFFKGGGGNNATHRVFFTKILEYRASKDSGVLLVIYQNFEHSIACFLVCVRVYLKIQIEKPCNVNAIVYFKLHS